MNKSESRNKVPEPPVASLTSGNLLSSVAPPSQLPNFITAPTVPNTVPQVNTAPLPVAVSVTSVESKPSTQPSPSHEIVSKSALNPQHVPIQPQSSLENFSPAIPLSKGEPMKSVRSSEDSGSTQPDESLPDSTLEADKLGNVMPGNGLFMWVKGAVTSGGILHKVAEKAKSSVDTMITTLDPQMKEYMKSGGDVYIVVASDKDTKISPVREAFQSIFGKATVVGHAAQSEVTAAQPVGYAAAYAAAKQRIAHLRSSNTDINNNVPVVAIENFIQEAISDRWYDCSLLVLSRPSLGIELQLQSQCTPVPSAAVAAAKEATPPDYPHAQTGYSVTIGAIMAANLQVPHTEWHHACTGVARRELLVLAARSLAGSYRHMLAVSAAEL